MSLDLLDKYTQTWILDLLNCLDLLSFGQTSRGNKVAAKTLMTLEDLSEVRSYINIVRAKSYDTAELCKMGFSTTIRKLWCGPYKDTNKKNHCELFSIACLFGKLNLAKNYYSDGIRLHSYLIDTARCGYLDMALWMMSITEFSSKAFIESFYAAIQYGTYNMVIFLDGKWSRNESPDPEKILWNFIASFRYSDDIGSISAIYEYIGKPIVTDWEKILIDSAKNGNIVAIKWIYSTFGPYNNWSKLTKLLHQLCYSVYKPEFYEITSWMIEQNVNYDTQQVISLACDRHNINMAKCLYKLAKTPLSLKEAVGMFVAACNYDSGYETAESKNMEIIKWLFGQFNLNRKKLNTRHIYNIIYAGSNSNCMEKMKWLHNEFCFTRDEILNCKPLIARGTITILMLEWFEKQFGVKLKHKPHPHYSMDD
jgi:hypothetical protein